MGFIVALPNPYDPEEEKVPLGDEFETEDEAIEWAATMFGSDEEGKLQIVVEYEDVETDD
jgi:hypothetical protein